MSDENVGGLPPLSEEIQGFLNVHPFGYSHALGLLKRYARDAISAHGGLLFTQADMERFAGYVADAREERLKSAHGENASIQTPVVDEAMVERFARGYFGDRYTSEVAQLLLPTLRKAWRDGLASALTGADHDETQKKNDCLVCRSLGYTTTQPCPAPRKHQKENGGWYTY